MIPRRSSPRAGGRRDRADAPRGARHAGAREAGEAGDELAKKAIEKGADGLVAVAAGAGGHAGVKSPFALIQEIRQWFDGPLALSGAISTGEAVLAALATQFPDALRHELRFPPVREGHKMIGTGMFIVNPPYGIETETKRLSACFPT